MHSTRSGWRAFVAALSAAILLVAVLAAPAAAVTDGTPDGNGHPYVGLMTAHAADGDYMHRCTGTLITSTVFVTAGHCTFGAEYAVVYFEAGPIEPDPAYDPVSRACPDEIDGYPCDGGVTGEVYTHPQYDDDLFYLYDLGVVVLDEPVMLADYGELPELNELDDLRIGTRFTSVGYGLQKSFPDAAAWKDVAIRERLVARPRLLQIDTAFTGEASILLSNNANTGGTCFGDSGGPNFLGNTNVIAGVTSFGINPTCAGTGGVYRIDQEDDLAWLATFLD